MTPLAPEIIDIIFPATLILQPSILLSFKFASSASPKIDDTMAYERTFALGLRSFYVSGASAVGTINVEAW